MNLLIKRSAYFFFLFFACLSACCSIHGQPVIPHHIKITTREIHGLKKIISITFFLSKKDFLYKDFFTFSVEHPAVHLLSWKTKNIAIPYYDPLFKHTKHIYKKKVCFSLVIAADEYIDEPIFLYCSYYQRSEKKIKQFFYGVSFNKQSLNPVETDNNSPFFTPNNNVVRHTSHTYIMSLNSYLTHIYTLMCLKMNALPITMAMHYVCIFILFLLCFLCWYIFNKKPSFLLRFHEHILFTAMVVYTLFIKYVLYIVYVYAPSTLVTPLFLGTAFFLGIFYIKKSTLFQSSCIRALCVMYGNVCIIATIPLLFKTIFTVLF